MSEKLVSVEVVKAEMLKGDEPVEVLEVGKPYYYNPNTGYCEAYQVTRNEDNSVEFLALWEEADNGETIELTNDGIGDGVVGQTVKIIEEDFELLKEHFEINDEDFPTEHYHELNVTDYFFIGIADCVVDEDAPDFVHEAVVELVA